jgi:exodeoxyribonuclease VII large subunit
MSLITDLLHFREEAARREGVESFKVLPKATLDAIAAARPQNKAELIAVKGIKEAKFRKYGQGILAVVAAHSVGETNAWQAELDVAVTEGAEEPEAATTDALTVNEFLESIDTELSGLAGRIQGEISDMNIWQQRVVFFSLKDKTVDSIMKCSMSYQNYVLSGAAFAVGDEIIVEGYPKIYKPRGELSFQVMTAELCGEGALKKAYDELYAKLEAEGAFAPEKKQRLPRYPEKIALITSLDGAAIGDFQMNLGRFGLKVDLYPSGVEGQRAIHELVAQVRAVAKRVKEYDALVIVRGGGGLESLQAFNNETLVRSLLALPIPVLAGIGHEKDITLASLVADQMESTPTACALRMTSHWQAARDYVMTLEQRLPRMLERAFAEQKALLSEQHQALFGFLGSLKEAVRQSEQNFMRFVHVYADEAVRQRKELAAVPSRLVRLYQAQLAAVHEALVQRAAALEQLDPRAVLSLGYSLVYSAGKLVRSTKELAPGDILEVRLGKGSVTTRIETITT